MHSAIQVRVSNTVEATNSGKQLSDFDDLAAWVSNHLDGGRSQSCRVVSFRRKMGKLIVEFDVETEARRDADLRRCIGKIYRSDRGQGQFDALSLLREAGFRPPSPYTVVYPVAYVADRRFLLQEKAPGRLLGDIIFDEPDATSAVALERAAGWLAALHTADIDAEPRLDHVRESVARHGRGLVEILPRQALRVKRLVACALVRLETIHLTPLVPCHGDFHPMNVFITDGGRVTAIDLDAFGLQERAADVAYMLAQMAIMGYCRQGSFAATVQARYCFLRAYLEAMPTLSHQRLALYLGIFFLQSLHYELCILGKEKVELVEPWLASAERCLLGGELALIKDTVGGI